ncbi:MAG: TfoX/Sxy family protein [Steroidobacteraceae bacterium]
MGPLRNAKVRRRIAAGKLRLRIRDLRNLGPRSEEMLAGIGIRSVEQLRERGAVPAFLALRAAGITSALNALWALVGALEPWPEGRDWRGVARGPERLALMLQVEQAQGATTAPAAKRRPATRGAGSAPGRRTLAEEAWAPGLPFEEVEGSDRAGRKTRRRRVSRGP